ncbi:MAG: hypothetical protein GF381_00445 [Candidatus Pacebacteria bacterium]|nr:hypothetical protein [Candidatus Paceibacterota bacterium]
MFSYQVETLKSGLKVIRVPMAGLKSVTALILVNTGSRYENEDQEGMAHCLEHLVFKGTKNYPDQKQIAVLLDRIGADSNAFTSKEYTGYYATAASDHLTQILEILKDLLFYPRLCSADLEQEKQVIIEEIKMYHDNPIHHIGHAFEQLVYQGTGLAHDISGSQETISQFQPQDLRQFLNSWYGLGNMVLVLAGDETKLAQDKSLEQVSQIFQDQPQERTNSYRIKLERYLSRNPISNQQLVVEKRATAQASLVMGWPGIERQDPRRYALSVLNTIVGGNRSSRLFQTVREEMGLAYYVYSDVDQYHDAGIFGAEAGVSPEAAGKAIKAIKQVFVDLAEGQRPVTKEEINQAKEYLAGRMVLGLESSQAVARYFGLKELLLNEIEDPDIVLDKMRAVTQEQVQELAAGLIKPGQLRLAVIGPFADKQIVEATGKESSQESGAEKLFHDLVK